MLARLALGAAVLLAVAAIRRVALPRDGTVWGHLAGAALFGNVLPFLLLSYGERTARAGIAGVLIGATPLLTLTIAYAALSAERATARKVIGLVVGFLGILLVLAPWQDAGGSIGGELACFGAAVSYAISFVYVRKFLSPRGIPAAGPGRRAAAGRGAAAGPGEPVAAVGRRAADRPGGGRASCCSACSAPAWPTSCTSA